MGNATVEMLADVSLFALLDEQERGLLAERVETVRFEEGKVIFNVGDPGASMYIVTEGEVGLSIKTKTGEEMFFESSGRGDFFGEISLLDEGPRTTDYPPARLTPGGLVESDTGERLGVVGGTGPLDPGPVLVAQEARALRDDVYRDLSILSRRRIALGSHADWQRAPARSLREARALAIFSVVTSAVALLARLYGA